MALTRVQAASTKGNSNTPSVTLGVTPVRGDLVVVTFEVNEDAGDVDIVIDPPGYLPIGDFNNTANCRIFSYWKIAGVAESTTISASFGSSARWITTVAQYNDSAGGTWGLDQNAGLTGPGSPANSGTTAVTTQADEVWVAGITNVDKNGSTQSAPTNGFALVTDPGVSGSGTTGLHGALYEKIVSAAAAANTTVTLTPGDKWAGLIATFYALPTGRPVRVSSTARRARVERVRRAPRSRLRKPTVELIVPYPANTVAPVVSGTTVVGQTLSTTNGTWTGSPTFTYQWERDNHGGGTYSPIPGATANTYLLADVDDQCRIRSKVTGYNARGAGGPATSNAVGLITEPLPVNTVLPVVTGTTQVGSPLTADTGTWLHMGGYNPYYTYQWQSSPDGLVGWTNIPAANFPFYWPVIGDLDLYLRVVVTAHNSGC